jgi:hypothetical protein
LPVPLSPVRSTALSVRATRDTSRKTRRIRGLAPMMLRNGSRSLPSGGFPPGRDGPVEMDIAEISR